MAYDAQGHKLTTYRGQTGYWGDEDESGEPFFIPATAAASTAGPLSTAMQMVQALQAGGIDPSNATVAQLEAARQAVAPAVSATSGGMAAPDSLSIFDAGKTPMQADDGNYYMYSPETGLDMSQALTQEQIKRYRQLYDPATGKRLTKDYLVMTGFTPAEADIQLNPNATDEQLRAVNEAVYGRNPHKNDNFLTYLKEAAPGIALVAGAGALGGAFPSLTSGLGGAGTVAGGAGETALAGGAAADTLGTGALASDVLAAEGGMFGLPTAASAGGTSVGALVPAVAAAAPAATFGTPLAEVYGGATGALPAAAAPAAAGGAAAAVPSWLGPVGSAAGGAAALAGLGGGGSEMLPNDSIQSSIDSISGINSSGTGVNDLANIGSLTTGPLAGTADTTGANLSLDQITQLSKVGMTAKQIADASKEPGMIDKLLSGTATATDLAKLGLGAAAVGGLLSEDPDRTSTTKVEYPDWYNEASKSAIALADKYAALGPDSVAPLSANETAAIQMAKDSAGNWKPLLDKSTATLDASRQSFDEAGALAGSVPRYLDKASGQIDAAMPYFKQAGEMAATVPGFTKRAGEQVDAAMPYFTKAGSMADSVSGYLNRSGALADEAAGGIPSINLSSYMNPYLDNVLAPIARRNEIAKAAALNDIKAKAGMRGAFGGSRSTLLEGQTSEAADRNLNEAEANIRSGAFTTGLTAAQADLNRKLAASGQFGALAGTAGNAAGIYGNLGKGIADTANVFNNAGAVSVGGANALNATGRGVADTAGAFTNMGTAATNAANAKTSIGRSLTDSATGFRSNAGALSDLTGDDITRLSSTGGTERSVEQAKLNAPLTAIGGYANALRGNPGATTTSVAPEASKIGQATGALTALLGANKAGWI